MLYNMKQGHIKNIKDLEYNRVLNRENILLVLVGTSLLSLILTEEIPFHISRWWLLAMLISIATLIIIVFNRRLSKILEEIRNL